MRRKRNEVSIQLRKARKNDQLIKKRNINLSGSLSDDENQNSVQTTASTLVNPLEVLLGKFAALILLLSLYIGLIKFRLQLSKPEIKRNY